MIGEMNIKERLSKNLRVLKLPSTGWQNSRRDRAHHIGPPRYAENAVGTLDLGPWHRLAFLKNYERGPPSDPKHAHTFCLFLSRCADILDIC